ncbi:HhoA/HhoB/HtrA family serine endopeptidase [Microseira wollei]|uniref:HtrA2 peptidase n=1 Tax=Microseira wollei NIES-4236 TaxID=2530354 RepID=A0AAV3XRY9_9CYAN|nr:HhoA/HhoB/HtrA family serine endopeptidase [Microseira wollei]GET44070.1 HtrA2 peptidase [Microseira wollei NIES-4236]
MHSLHPVKSSDLKPSSPKGFSLATPIKYLSLMLLGAGVTFAGSYFTSMRSPADLSGSQLTQAPLPPTVNSPPIRFPGGTNTNFITNVVDKVGPAVVTINASRTVRNPMAEEFEEDPMEEFFGSQRPQQPRRRVESGTGSGFIISANGQILTNAHVVDGAERVNVTLKDGRSFQGRVVGTDRVTDVAVVKIEANGLPTASLGNSDQLRPGEWAIAIGNPLGLDNTVTTGIISGTGRSGSQVGVPDKRVRFIQTDAAINPGNSGGPLLNAAGQVIGINTAIIQGAQGLGFAIPINTAQNIANQLISKGRVEHPYLGIQMVTLTPEVKQNINSSRDSNLSIDEDRGVLIARVMPNSPAARAGLRSGDVLTQINGQSVKDADAVQRAVENTKVGDNLQVGLRRSGQSLNLTVQTGAFPANSPQ